MKPFLVRETVFFEWLCPKCGIDQQGNAKKGKIVTVLRCFHCGFAVVKRKGAWMPEENLTRAQVRKFREEKEGERLSMKKEQRLAALRATGKNDRETRG